MVRPDLRRTGSASTPRQRSSRSIQMVNFNRVVLAGNLTRDPELRFTQQGVPVASLSIAVNPSGQKAKPWIFSTSQRGGSLEKGLPTTRNRVIRFLLKDACSTALGKLPMGRSEAPWTWLPITYSF